MNFYSLTVVLWALAIVNAGGAILTWDYNPVAWLHVAAASFVMGLWASAVIDKALDK